MELTQEQTQDYLNALSKFGNTVRSIMPHEKAVETLHKMTDLVIENPSMIQDISSFDNWGGIQQMAKKIGDDLTKNGRKVTLADLFKIFPKVKKEVAALK